MSNSRLGAISVVAAVDAALLLVVGAAMWSKPPTPAEEAVGKGLMAIGTAVAVVAFAALCLWLNAHGDELRDEAPDPGRSDWENA